MTSKVETVAWLDNEGAAMGVATLAERADYITDAWNRAHAEGRITELVRRSDYEAAIARAAEAKSELELRRKSGSAVDRLHNLCEGIAESADGSEWSREEWGRLDAENLELRKRAEALHAALKELVEAERNATSMSYNKREVAAWAAARAIVDQRVSES